MQKAREMAKRTTKTAAARTAARVMCDPEEVRKVMAKLTDGVPFTTACSHYWITPAQFWKRVLNDRGLKREVAMTCITQAWDRADKASASLDNMSALATFVKLSKEMAASLAPDDWGEKVQVESRALVVNCNLDFQVADRLDDVMKDITPTVVGSDD